MNLTRLTGSIQAARRTTRRGLSLIELIGCLAATAAGIWLGTSYLGINLAAAWQIGLEKAGVASPQHADSPQQSGESPQPVSGESGAAASTANVSPVSGEATVAYWNQLRTVMQSEQVSRHARETGRNGDMRGSLHAQGRSFRQAADAVAQLKPTGVDQELLQFTKDLVKWYESGIELSNEGALVLDEGDLTAANGPIGRRWHTSQKQHREELDLLIRKLHALQSKLMTRYDAPFPGLQ